jgi:glycosyltransferase involved in cell wall biosynthesis
VAAVRTALDQTMRDIEVVVVLDGPGEETAAALDAIDDGRLRVERLAAPVGAGGARNEGVAAARGEWVAFLDDDDLWDPRKLELQFDAAAASAHPEPIVTCRVRARGPGGEAVWPRRLPRPGEHLSEYLFTRRGLFWGEGLVHMSTIFARRELLERVPFRTLKKHEDWDWLLHAVAGEGAAVTFVRQAEPLAVWNVDEGRPRTSTRPDWRVGLDHIRGCSELVTPRAYASYLLTVLSAEAAEQRDLHGAWALLREASLRGRPRAADLLVFAGIMAVPRGLRARLRDRIAT